MSDGADQFRIRKVVDKISCIASIVDEAFVLLALENGYEMWNHQVLKARSLEEVGREANITWKWTANARICKMGEGWQKNGLIRFNELCSFVMKDREKELGRNTFGFENWYLKNKQEEVNIKKRKRNLNKVSESVVAFNMLEEEYSEDEEEVLNHSERET